MRHHPFMAPSDQPEAIAEAVSGFLLQEPGYAQPDATASIGGRLVTVILQHPLSVNEYAIAQRGGHEGVRQLRCEVLESMRVELIAIVERTVGRSVMACLVASHIDPDIDVVVFVLAESPGNS